MTLKLLLFQNGWTDLALVRYESFVFQLEGPKTKVADLVAGKIGRKSANDQLGWHNLDMKLCNS